VRDIARAAGQNVAAIAYYYGSKERLYRAVLGGFVQEIRHALSDVLAEIGSARTRGNLQPQDATRLLQKFLCQVYVRLLSRTDVVALARILVREQMQPTPAFEILYQQGFRELHESLCFLVGSALGTDPHDQETILRTHTIMGQVYFFAMSRETILRRLGWKDLEGEKAERVTAILDENIRVLLSGLRRKADRGHQTKELGGPASRK
jgi:AcrR family transcriptional regulator